MSNVWIRPSRIRIGLGVAFMGLVSVVVSCGSDDADSRGASPSYPPNGETVAIQALDNSFRPVEFEISAGTKVVFENRGRNDHNILPNSVVNDAELTELLTRGDDQAWGVIAADFAPGDVYSYVFTVPGTYAYYCSIHGTADAGMYGTVTVTDPGEN